MATFDVAKLLNKITQDIPGINTVLKALAKWDVSALTDVPDGAMQATTDTNNRLTIRKKVSGSYTPVAKLMHDVDTVDGYHASASATANAVAVRNSSGALPGNITGNAATADTAVALAAGSVVPVSQGGTGATTASQARTNLGVAGSADFTAHIAKQSSPTVEGHVKLDALAADGSNTAAPGGFGLGKTAGRDTGTTLNNLLEGGFYTLPTSPHTSITDVTFPDIGNGTMLVIPRGNETIQLFFCSLGWMYRRYHQPTATWGVFTVIPNGITDSTNTTSSKIAASATAVKAAYDRAKQVATASITGGIKVGGAISSVSSDGTVTLSSATTTSRGIGRVATLADMAPGAVVENGPAVIDANGGVITPTPTAHAVPQADASGKLDGWVSLNGKANTNLSNLAPAAQTVIRNAMKAKDLGSRTTSGTWTLTGVEIGLPLFIVTDSSSTSGDQGARLKVSSGGTGGTSGSTDGTYLIGRGATLLSSNVFVTFPTSSTVVIAVASVSNATISARQ